MFSNMTYENILNDMLSRITNDVDKREGSPIYMAIAPCAYKLAETYFMLDNFVDLFFIDTAIGEYLDRICKGYGIERKRATKALRWVSTDGMINIGTRFALRDTTYVIVNKISNTEYIAECEQVGSVGNLYNGKLDNIENIGVTATLTDIVSTGTDTETDEGLRNRLYVKIQLPSTSGNINDYLNWALKVEGVGNARVFPLWNGPGTVKVVIVDSDMEIDSTLETKVYDYIETVRPIGADVTVTSPSALNIDIAANVQLDGSKALAEVLTDFESKLREYFKSVVFKDTSISYARIGSLLLDIQGVRDYTNLLVNSGTGNISIGEEEIPVLNDVSLSEV